MDPMVQGIWPIPVASVDESCVSEIRGRMRMKDAGSEDESSRLASTTTNGGGGGNDLTDTDAQFLKALGSKEANGDVKHEPEASSGITKKLVDQNGQPCEPSKQDYIHVRARRGQATDSHSLAERARREKISERMKILQDLVPGCNKVIGKASVLDEIINYIQALQCQVEFLSMKLEAVNSQMNPNMEEFPAKDYGAPAYETASSMAYSSQATQEYGQRSAADWLHMQVGAPERVT